MFGKKSRLQGEFQEILLIVNFGDSAIGFMKRKNAVMLQTVSVLLQLAISNTWQDYCFLLDLLIWLAISD
ncbi:hypothetical protein ACJX0J_029833, partial [Zea mays]